jgi:hypothetical protein
MANKKNWLGMLIIMLAFGTMIVGFIGCSKNVDRRLNGTWESENGIIKQNSGNFENSDKDGTPTVQGTYTTSDNKITLTVSHYFGTGFGSTFGLEPRWYSKNELETALGFEFDAFDPYTSRYTVKGNTFTVIDDDDSTFTYTLVKRDGKFTKVASSREKSVSAGKSSGKVSAIPGRWYLVEGPSSYPDNVDLLKDGNGIAEDAAFSWKIENGRFYIIHPFFGLSAIYTISDSTLMLTKDNGEILIYKKK